MSAPPDGPTGAASLAEFYQASAYARFPQEHRAGGTLGAGMVFARQEAIEITDPAVPQIAFVGARRVRGWPGRVRLRRRLA